MAFYSSVKTGAVDSDVELDLTNSHLHDLDGIEFLPTLEYIDLTANRLKSVDQRLLHLTGMSPSSGVYFCCCTTTANSGHSTGSIRSMDVLYSGVRFLCLRQNLLGDGDWLQDFQAKAVLEELHLNDNQLKLIPNLQGFTALSRLELSYNHEIRSLEPLTRLSAASLCELYVAVNKVSIIQGLSHLTGLTCLELGSNRIPRIENVSSLTGLQQMWLGRNRISEISNLGSFVCLRQLSLQANRLECMAGVGGAANLEELYLSQNGITRIEGLSLLTKLRVLDLAHNRIEEVSPILRSLTNQGYCLLRPACMAPWCQLIEWHISGGVPDLQSELQVEGLEAVTDLSDLWLNNNPLRDLDHLDAALAPCKQTLKVVYLESSPAARSSKGYLHVMKQMLPSLEFLDSTQIVR